MFLELRWGKLCLNENIVFLKYVFCNLFFDIFDVYIGICLYLISVVMLLNMGNLKMLDL